MKHMLTCTYVRTHTRLAFCIHCGHVTKVTKFASIAWEAKKKKAHAKHAPKALKLIHIFNKPLFSSIFPPSKIAYHTVTNTFGHVLLHMSSPIC